MPDSHLDRRRRVASALRQLSEQLLSAEMREEELDSLAESVEALTEQVAAQPRVVLNERYRIVRDGVELSEEESWDGDPLVGGSNPLAVPLLETGTPGEWGGTFGPLYEGHPGLVHGGFVAATLDHVLGCVASTAEGTSLTGTLTVRYRKPTPAGKRLLCRGEIERTEGRKVFCHATLKDGDVVVAEADGIFFRVDRRVL